VTQVNDGSGAAKRTLIWRAGGDLSQDAVTSGATYNFGYDARKRLVSAGAVGGDQGTYGYDYLGRRVWRTVVGSVATIQTHYVFDEAGRLLAEHDGSTGAVLREYVWLDDTPVAVLKLRGGATNGGPTGSGSDTPWQGLKAGGVDVYWIESDQLDTPRAIVNATHQLIWHWDSDPFGTTAPDQAPSQGSGITTAFVYNLRFPGQYFDAETGTHYNYFRDYEPETGRYVESDPAGLEFSINSFSYVGSNTMNWFDPDGLGRLGDFTKRQKKDQFRKDPKCHYCGKITIKCLVPHPDRFHADHYDSLANGGTGDSSNLVSACQQCNLEKGAMNGSDFKKKKRGGGGRRRR